MCSPAQTGRAMGVCGWPVPEGPRWFLFASCQPAFERAAHKQERSAHRGPASPCTGTSPGRRSLLLQRTGRSPSPERERWLCGHNNSSNNTVHRLPTAGFFVCARAAQADTTAMRPLVALAGVAAVIAVVLGVLGPLRTGARFLVKRHCSCRFVQGLEPVEELNM